ncbi:MAG: beta-ketoacyl-[acyl-carrier-protein] synthase family protein [Verrucomicrobia bacterium]|nr:beta-ketoacyl-[acyl-carrier-protein] synthase family protein [Verrucomicrobiota bacterium]
MRRVVITGIGPITCIGIGLEEFWQGLRAERSGISRLTFMDPEVFGVQVAGEVRGFEPGQFFTPKRLKRLDRYAQFAVASAILAVRDAGLELSAATPNPRHGVSYGTALGGIANAEHQCAKFVQNGPGAVSPGIALQVFGGSAHSNIAIEFGLRGPGTTNSNSCASGPVAMGEAMRYIRDGWADVMIAGAAEAPLSPLTFGAFALIKAMSPWAGDPPGGACRSFDAARDGFTMGEGGTSFVLEEYEHARRRGARIYGELLGYALNNDAHHMTNPLPTGESAVACMRAALDDARVRPEEVDYINAHASSTKANDATEVRAIKQVFGEHAYRIPVSGTKGYHAHALGATGCFEAAACCLALTRGWIPPTLHLVTPDPECDLDHVPQHGRELQPKRVLSNSFGFGGINACIVLGEV